MSEGQINDPMKWDVDQEIGNLCSALFDGFIRFGLSGTVFMIPECIKEDTEDRLNALVKEGILKHWAWEFKNQEGEWEPCQGSVHGHLFRGHAEMDTETLVKASAQVVRDWIETLEKKEGTFDVHEVIVDDVCDKLQDLMEVYSVKREETSLMALVTFSNPSQAYDSVEPEAPPLLL